MRTVAVLILVFAARLVQAQTFCPPVGFRSAVHANLRPDASTRVTMVLQPDGSYTAYEMADSSPYAVTRRTLDIGTQLASCLTGQSSLPALPAPSEASSPGAPSQTQALARLPSGGYLHVQRAESDIIVSRFDSGLSFISETRLAFNSSQYKLVDVNKDGALDLIANRIGGPHSSAAIGVFLGTGDAGFRQPIEYALPASEPYHSISSYSLGDLNGDGRLDLVVAITGFGDTEASLVVLIGNGDGTFRDRRTVVVDRNPLSTALADLNGDSKLDMVLSVRDDSYASVVRVALGTGDGAFGPFVSYPAASAGSLALGDLDGGDGALDVVSSGVSILFGDGKGNFPGRADYLTETPGNIVLTDLNRDGRLDIIEGAAGNPFAFTHSSSTANTQASILFGLGNGRFWGALVSMIPEQSTPVDSATQVLAVADLDGDGSLDLAGSRDLGRTVAALKGSGTGAFSLFLQIALPSDSPGWVQAIVARDFNVDGKLDLVVAVSHYDPAMSNFVLVFPGRGDGTFQRAKSLTLPVGNYITSLAADDFNRDGLPDVAAVVSTQNSGPADAVQILLGNGDGSFRSPVSYSVGPRAWAMVSADLNGDNFVDLAVTNLGTGKSDGNVRLLLGKGDGTFTIAPAIPLTDTKGQGPLYLAASDLSSDGVPDLAVTFSGWGDLVVLLGQRDGTFSRQATHPIDFLSRVTVGDLNNDHIPDLVLDNTFYGTGTGHSLGLGGGAFAPVTPIAGTISNVIAGDFNRDGQIDLAAGVGSYGVVTFLNTSRPQSPFAVVSSASYAVAPVAPGSLVSAFGEDLAVLTASSGEAPLPEILNGTWVSVQGAAGESLRASLLYVSPRQINFLIPSASSTGAGTVTVTSDIGALPIARSAPIEIARVSPALFSLNSTGLAAAYAIRVKADGSQAVEPVFRLQNGTVVSSPIDLGPGADQVYLALFGTGIRNAAPGSVTVRVRGINAAVTYSGPQNYFPGLDQVNVLLPPALAGSGAAGVVLTAGGISSNTVTVTIK